MLKGHHFDSEISSLPGCGAGVSQGQVADTLIVHRAEDGQRTADGMAPFYADQTANFSASKSILDAWNHHVSVQVGWSWNRCSTLGCSDELEDFRIGSDHTVDHVDLLRRLDNSIFVLSVAADIGRPKLLELDLSVELIWTKSSKLYLSTDFALS